MAHAIEDVTNEQTSTSAGTGAPSSTAPQTTRTDGSPPSEGQKSVEPSSVDERGVPWENRAKEAERKLADLAGRVESLESSRVTTSTPPSPAATERPLTTEEFLEQTELTEKQAQGVLWLVNQLVPQHVQTLQHKQRQESEKHTWLQKALTEFGDLKNPQSALYRRANEILQEDQDLQKSTRGVYRAAKEAALELGIMTTKQEHAADEAQRSTQAEAARTGAASSPPSAKAKGVVLSEQEKQAARAMNWSEDQYREAKALAGAPGSKLDIVERPASY